MTVEEIVTRVRKAIDELTQSGTNLDNLTDDEASLDAIIVDKIGYALTFVLENAPLDKLDKNTFTTMTAAELAESFSIDGTSLMATVKLSDDMLRIVEARLSSWSLFPLPVPDTSEVYLMQQDKYARGSYDRPVNVFTYHGAQRVLEMYCAKSTTDTLNFAYIKKPDVSSIDTEHMQQEISVPSKLDAALVYQVAGLTMTAFREEIAASLFAIAKGYMGLGSSEE